MTIVDVNFVPLCQLSRSLIIVQKQVKQRTSLVSKSLPIKQIPLATSLFIVQKTNLYVLPDEMLYSYQYHRVQQFPSNTHLSFDS